MGSTVSGRAIARQRTLCFGLFTLSAITLLSGGCSKTASTGDDAKKAAADSGANPASADSGVAVVAPPSIYTRGEVAPAKPAADNAWAERCKKTSLIAQANELATQARAFQDQEDFAAAGEKLNAYVAVQIQMNGEKSDFVKSARNRVAENRWLASLTPADRKLIKQAAQIEADAEAESTKGHFEVALSKGLDAIRLYQQVGSQQSAAYGRLALFIADKYALLGDFKSAAQAYQHGLAVTEQTEGLVSPVYGNGLLAMSGMWMNMGDYVEAVQTLQRACDVFSMLGEEDTSTAYCLMMIGVIYKEVGDFDQSANLLKQAMQKADDLGPNGRSIAGECLQHLAGVYYRAQNYPAAETTQLKAMEVLQEAFGESPILIGCRSRLARIYIKTGQLAQAETILKNAITAGKEAFGESSPVPSYAMQYLGELYVAKQNYAAAEPLLASALATREKGHGSNHPAIAEVLDSYCLALRGLGRAAEAEQLEARKKSIDAGSVAMREKLGQLSAKMIAARPTRRE
ncbi:MAG TPA: tetratricopeptide repeat protein [Pirellulales bacterium]|jgi:hypothetical protein|nr:tetratricopeptide repeat protein [Pirellulales bacterium]